MLSDTDPVTKSPDWIVNPVTVQLTFRVPPAGTVPPEPTEPSLEFSMQEPAVSTLRAPMLFRRTLHTPPDALDEQPTNWAETSGEVAYDPSNPKAKPATITFEISPITMRTMVTTISVMPLLFRGFSRRDMRPFPQAEQERDFGRNQRTQYLI